MLKRRLRTLNLLVKTYNELKLINDEIYYTVAIQKKDPAKSTTTPSNKSDNYKPKWQYTNINAISFYGSIGASECREKISLYRHLGTSERVCVRHIIGTLAFSIGFATYCSIHLVLDRPQKIPQKKKLFG